VPARPIATAMLAGLVLVVTAGPTHAVVGGVHVDPASAPYVASLAVCTGSLIAPDRVLTAAHCTDDLAVGQRVTFAGGEVRHIARTANDYDYPRNLIANVDADDPHPFDAAVIELDHPVNDIAPIALATATNAAAYAAGTRATTYGYGVDGAHRQVGAGVLRSGAVEIHGDRDCESLLAQVDSADEFVAPQMLCTTDPDGRAPFVSGCFGDSGGPLVIAAPGVPPLEVGIDNWGVYCGAHDGDPENYADVAAVEAFATAATVRWQPLALARPTLRGTFDTGHTVFCTAPAYADPQPTKLVYSFDDHGVSVARPSTRRRFHIPSLLRDERLTCSVAAESAGGRTFSDESAAARIGAGRGTLHG
jgi:trypsin